MSATTPAGTYAAKLIDRKDPYVELARTTFTVAKADPEYTVPTAADLTYTGSDQELVTGGSSNLLFKVDDGEWSKVKPARTAVGTYTVYWKVDASTIDTDNYNIPEDNFLVEIKKATIETPTLTDNAITYTGEALPLIPEVTSDVGTVIYSLNDGAWSTHVPTATERGEYKVSCMIQGDDNYIDSGVATATINILRPCDDHKWAYTDCIDGIRTVTCKDELCPFHTEGFTLSIAAAGKAYDGTPVEATTSIGEGAPEGEFTIGDVRYYAGTSSKVPALDSAPSEAGTYVADAEFFRNGTKVGTIWTNSFDITQAENEVSVELDDWRYDGTAAGSEAHKPVVTATFGADTATFTYTDADGADIAAPKDPGTYNIIANIEATGDYAGGTSEPYAFTIAEAPHTIHDWDYGSPDTATGKRHVYCKRAEGEEECAYNEGVDLILTAKDKAYDGTPFEATTSIEGNDPDSLFVIDETIEYHEGSTKLDAAPTDVGSYEAWVAFSVEGTTIGRIKKAFEITQAENTVSVELEGWRYDETAAGSDDHKPVATADFGADTATFKYTDAEGNAMDTAPMDPGTYHVIANIPETSNYAACESEPFEFTIDKALHTEHNWKYGKIDNTTGRRRVHCEPLPYEEQECEYSEGFDLILTADGKAYDGEAVEATAGVGEGAPEGVFKFENIEYFKDSIDDANKVDEAVDVGSYIARATIIANGDTIGYVRKAFEITQAENTVSVELEGWRYDETAAGSDDHKPVATADFGADTATFAYTDAEGNAMDTAPMYPGTYHVIATIEKTANYAGCVSEPFEFTIDLAEHTEHHWVIGSFDPETGIRHVKCVPGEYEEQECEYSEGFDLVLTAQGKVYDGTPVVAEPSIDGNAPEGVFTFDEPIEYYGGETQLAEAPADAGRYVAKVWFRIDGKKTGSIAKSYAISKRPVQVNITENEKEYDNNPLNPDAYTLEVDESTPLPEGVVLENIIKGEITRKAGEDVGEYAFIGIDLKEDAAKNYTLTLNPVNFTVIQATSNPVTIELPGWVYDGTYAGSDTHPVTTTAKFAAEGEPTITYSKTEDFAETIDAPKDAGTYYVKATVAEHPNYVGNEAIASFTIEKKDATITIDDKTSIYKSPLAELTSSVDGLIGDETLDYEIETWPEVKVGSPVGTYLIMTKETAEELAEKNPNYEIAVIPGYYEVTPAEMSVAIEGFSKTYDGKEVVLEATLHDETNNADVDPEDATVYYSMDELSSLNYFMLGARTTPYTFKDVMEETEIFFYVETTNYTPTPKSGVVTAEIKPAKLTVSGKEVTTPYGTLVRFKDTDEFVTYNGFVESETKDTALTGTLKFSYANGYNQYSDVGTYGVTLDGLSAKNYSIVYEEGTINVVEKELTFTWSTEENVDGFVFPYTGKEHSITAKTDGILNRDKSAVKPIIRNNAETNVKRDENWISSDYTATVELNDVKEASNYKIVEGASQTFRITPATLTLTPKDVTVVYGEEPKAAGFKAVPLMDADKGADATTPKDGVIEGVAYGFGADKDHPYKKGDDVGTYKVWLDDSAINTKDGLRANNYDLATPEGKLTVTARPLTLEWSKPNSFVYNGKERKVTAKLQNVFGKDKLDLTYEANTAKDAGSYTAKATAITGDKAGNYIFAKDAKKSYDWKITPKKATIKAKNKTIYYKQAPANAGYKISGLVKGDKIGKISYKYTYKKNGKPGKYQIIPVLKNANPNYTVTLKPGKLTVKKNTTTLTAKAKVTGPTTATFSWNKITKAAKYEVALSRCNHDGEILEPVTIKTLGKGKTSFTKGGLTQGLCYKYCVTALDKDGNVISESRQAHFVAGDSNGIETNPKSLTVKKNSITLKVGKTATIKGSQSPVVSYLPILAHTAPMRFRTSNAMVAKVNKNGVITAVGKGYCEIYVQAINGITKKIEVNVK